MTRSSFDTYFACTWTASLVALLFGIFKCRSMADVLFGLSETDAQVSFITHNIYYYKKVLCAKSSNKLLKFNKSIEFNYRFHCI